MKTAVVFAGQGSQYPGMGKDLYDRFQTFKEIIDKADECTDLNLKEKMFNADEKELARTEIIQPVMAAFGYGVFALFKEAGIKVDFTAGLSLGEYGALAASGVFDLETLIKITAFRGRVMKEAGEGLDAKMIAVLGGEEESIEEACRQACESTGEYVAPANYNSRGQVVISGEKQAADEAARILKDKDLKCIPLKVSSAFHTKFMEPAAEKLKGYFKSEVAFHEMQIPVVFNVTGSERRDEDSIPGLLEMQVKSPVKMRQTIEYLENKGVERVIEIGPGKVISGFIRKTAPDMECVSVEDAEGVEGLKEKAGS